MNLKLNVLVLSILYCVQSSYSDRPVTGKALPLENSRLGIYDGTPTTIEKHPYLVSILSNKVFLCACTIVSRSWVVTLGDCVTGLDPSELTVVAGSDDSSTGTTYTVQTVTLHPHYGKTVYDYDYACVQINGSFKWSNKVRPIKLPRREPKANANLIVAGWGDTSDKRGKQSNSQLMQGKMKWLAKKVCEETWADYGITWTERMACAYNKGKTTLCSGDWADAFVKKGLFYGMFAAGGGGFCSSSAIPVLIADIVPAAAWIKQTTGATLEDL
uniref:Peptidase S1 domain-containing protein n=1 Tax=Homalodisca liturata TaxID=320908 RepID=A0A1B6JGP8_9HEMI